MLTAVSSSSPSPSSSPCSSLLWLWRCGSIKYTTVTSQALPQGVKPSALSLCTYFLHLQSICAHVYFSLVLVLVIPWLSTVSTPLILSLAAVAKQPCTGMDFCPSRVQDSYVGFPRAWFPVPGRLGSHVRRPHVQVDVRPVAVLQPHGYRLRPPHHRHSRPRRSLPPQLRQGPSPLPYVIFRIPISPASSLLTFCVK